ncbi:MAG: DUF499 domain-containing protein, partial [Desulfovibrionaceae bacterium]|nr:DUF499 domain-containing protein [Desulfovibrionaceae bacterium]
MGKRRNRSRLLRGEALVSHEICRPEEYAMLGLKLRDEFLGATMPGTVIELRNSDNQGAVQKSPEQILSITYPTADVQIAITTVSEGRGGLPVVLVGGKGRGKSHIMAVMHHAVESPAAVESWMKEWGAKLAMPKLHNASLLKGYVPISEPMHNHEYQFLWELLFERHPKGEYYRGQFENMGQPVPPRSLLEKMFSEQPACLILDEFQTWYTGLPETNSKTGQKTRQNAFNFIQILSELATDRPDILIFVISVLDTNNEAYHQIHRQGPVLINFHGPTAKQDRQNLLLHRLFDNRAHIPEKDVEHLAAAYAAERFRLLSPGKSEHEKDVILKEVADCWPFSPELIDLLENHILMYSAAQNTRDLIRVLAQVYKSRGSASPVVTPADFFVDGDQAAAQVLVDAVASSQNPTRLIEIAQTNLKAVRDAGAAVTHDREMISAIWMYSLVLGTKPGLTAPKLHLVITRDKAIDDNVFQADLARLVENSFNIHGDEAAGGLLRFEMEENPRSRIKAYAKNDKLWDASATPSPVLTIYPGKDIEHIRKTLKAIFVPENQEPTARIIILGPNWRDNPWVDVDDAEQPTKWDRQILLVIPEKFSADKAVISETLGGWLAKHVTKNRNTARFLLIAAEEKNLFLDQGLIFSARCSYLCSKYAWGQQDRKYSALAADFDRSLRNDLQSRFNRFAILRKWDFQQPAHCVFDVEKITAQGAEIPKAVEEKIAKDIFDQTEFRRMILEAAKNGELFSGLLNDLSEPPPPGKGEAIPYLGEIALYEQVLRIAAQGVIVLNVSGTWVGSQPQDGSEDASYTRIKSKA